MDRGRRPQRDARAARGRVVAVLRFRGLAFAGCHELEPWRLGDERREVPDAPDGDPLAIGDLLNDRHQVFDPLDLAVRRPDDLRRVLALELLLRRVPRLAGKPGQCDGDRARRAGVVLHPQRRLGRQEAQEAHQVVGANREGLANAEPVHIARQDKVLRRAFWADRDPLGA